MPHWILVVGALGVSGVLVSALFALTVGVSPFEYRSRMEVSGRKTYILLGMFVAGWALSFGGAYVLGRTVLRALGWLA
jgi:hypothetical protein